MGPRTHHRSALSWLAFAGLLVLCTPVFVGSVTAVEVTSGPSGDAPETPTETALTDSSPVEFENETYHVTPPATAAIDIAVTDGGFSRLVIDAPGAYFTVELLVGYPQDTDELTLFFDTGGVGSADPAAFLSAANGTIHRITVHENRVGDTLPGGRYQLRALDDGNRSVATLDVSPSVRFDVESALNQSAIERQPVQTITGETDLPAGERVQIQVIGTGSDAFRLETETVVATDGTFETAIDLRPVPAGASFDIVARHDNRTRARRSVGLSQNLPEPTGGRQVSNGITFAYQGAQLSLATGPNQTLSGETTLTEGAVVTVILRSQESHLHVMTTRVDSYGAFQVRTDLSHLSPRDDVIVSAVAADGSSGAAPVVLTADEETDDGAIRGVTEIQIDSGNDGVGQVSAEQNLLGGLFAIVLGVVLSLLASVFLLGFRRSFSF